MTIPLQYDYGFNPDFIKIAEAYGIPGYRVGKKKEVPTMIQKALNTKGPILLEFVLDKDAHVYPMVPPGDDIKNIIEGVGQ